MTTREWCLSKRPICFIRGWSATKRKYVDAKSDPNTWKTFRYYCLHHIHPSHPYFIINHSPHSTPYFPFTFTYTFHLFLSIHNPQIKARGSFICLLPISISTLHCHLPFSFSIPCHFHSANKPCFNANYWVHSPLSLSSL